MRISASLFLQLAVGTIVVSASSIPTTNGHLSLARSKRQAELQKLVGGLGEDSDITPVLPGTTDNWPLLSKALEDLKTIMQWFESSSQARPSLECYCGSGVLCCDYPEGPACMGTCV